MRGVNKVILIGSVGVDPEVRYTASGNPIANISLATDDSYKDRNSGQQVKQTDWHRIVVFGKLAEVVQQYVKKGTPLYIMGKQKTRKWQDLSGQDRYTTEVVVDINGELQMLGGGQGQNQGQGQSQGQGQNQGQNQGQGQPAANQTGAGGQPAGQGGYAATGTDDGFDDGFDPNIPF